MNYIIILVAALGVLSLLQRLLPWIIYKSHKGETFLTNLFDYVAISAFGALMIENIQSFSPESLVPLIPAVIVAYWTRNAGATVLVAMLASLVLRMFGL
ncbi:MAG: AzlD domain-containing protein [Candidatus Thermoplasmatota archaeon]|jgi:branched-subunit amino acid transport protein|nr:AzlD domain-containing protein [Candidatus Thermoplasmatota archaeon]MCL5955338.1 AzlD domain-containing protein [Candidatus Thermoplasmatota archaeon]